MKKINFTILLSSISLLTFAQGPEFTINFEDADPLSSLPAGVTSVNPQDLYETPEAPGVLSDSIEAFIGSGSYYFIEEGGDLVTDELFTQRNQFDNVIKDVDGNNLLQTDFTGHLVIDETALGADSYTVRLNMAVFGHRMGGIDAGIFTITGNDGGVYKDDRVTSRNGGFTTGFGDSAGTGGASGFQYNQTEPPYREVVITYNDTDKLYRVYIDGAEQLLSEEAQTSGDWTDRKFYIGFNGQSSPKSTEASHIDPATGEFTSNGVRVSDSRTADLQMRMDNIQVYKRAITGDEVTTLFNGGNLSSNSVSKQTFNLYPNPVKDQLHFSSEEIYTVEVYNTLGSKISSQNLKSSVDMSNLKSGVYLVKFINEKGLVINTSKVVKN